MRTLCVYERDDSGVIPMLRSRMVEGCPLPDTYLHGRPVYIEDIEYVGIDSFILNAVYADTSEDVDLDDLELVQEAALGWFWDRVAEHYGYFPK
jgi:hypothetical protein